MVILIKLFFILTLIPLYQCCISIAYKHVNRDIDESSNSKYPWLVVIRNLRDPNFKLAYGSLIHPRAVLTSALGIVGHTEKDMIVETDCQDNATIFMLTNCITRKITSILYTDGFNGETISFTAYAILILSESFNIDNRINIINVAKSLTEINQNSCFFTRWMREYSITHNRTGLVTVKYNAVLSGEEFKLAISNEDELKTDRDWIISRSYHLYSIIKEDELPLIFIGSPLVCELKETSQKYVLMGVANFGLKLRLSNDSKTLVNIKSIGSVININHAHDEIIRKLETTVNLNGNFNINKYLRKALLKIKSKETLNRLLF